MAPNDLQSMPEPPPAPRKVRSGFNLIRHEPQELLESEAYRVERGSPLHRAKADRGLIEQSNPARTSNAIVNSMMSSLPPPPAYKISAPKMVEPEWTLPDFAARGNNFFTTASVGAITSSDSSTDVATMPESAPERLETTTRPDSAIQMELAALSSDLASSSTSPVKDIRTAHEYRRILYDAQLKYGPQARVLVGNLPNDLADEMLAWRVEEVFGDYGKCVACVFRGSTPAASRRPYAIVQYTKEQDAMAAFCCGQERFVLGRPARVELSKSA